MTQKLEEATAKALMERMHKRAGEGGESYHEVDRLRLQQYFQEPSQNPPVIKGWEGHAKQTTWLRDTARKLIARLTENAPNPQVSAPRKSSNLEKQASECEMAMVSMFDDVKDDNGGIGIESELAFGLSTISTPILHWCLNDSIYDGLTTLDYEERDDFGDDDDANERARYTEDDYAEVTARKKAKKYRETEDSLTQRRSAERAKCGSPWTFEVLESTKFAYVENNKADRRQHGMFKYGLIIREVDLIDWFDEDKLTQAQVSGGPSFPSDVLPGGTTDTWRPTANDMGKKVILYQLWSRDTIYEWVKGLPQEASGKVKEYRAIKNRQKFVAFAFCPANVTLSDDHVHRYEPALTSMYRMKPEFDRLYMNYGILAESTAVPRYIIINKDGLPKLSDETGTFMMFGDHALAAKYLEPGEEIQRLGGEGVGGDFVKFLEWSQSFMERGMPSTGHAEIESSTKPWTGRMMLTEANIEPAMYLDHMGAALRIMVRNIADVNGSEDGPGDICFYPKDGDKDALIVIKPEQWRGLRYDVDINKTSAVEQVTKMEHGRELLNDPLVGMTPIEFIRDYEGKPDAEDVWAEREAFKQSAPIITNLSKMKVTKWAGAKYAITPDLQFVDATNRIVTPGEALQSAGLPTTPQPQGMPVPPGGGGNGMVNPQLTMPSMPTQPAQNGMPAVGGLVG